MLDALARRFNPVDLLVLAIFVRCIWVGRDKGPRIEAFKLAGVIFATFVVFHYYGKLGGFLSRVSAFPVALAEVLAFVGLWVLTTIVFFICCDAWQLMYKPEEKNVVHRSVPAAIIGGIRACFVISLTLVMLMLTGHGHVQDQVSRSLGARFFGELSILTYQGVFTAISIPFPAEKRNEAIIRIYLPPEDDAGPAGALPFAQ